MTREARRAVHVPICLHGIPVMRNGRICPCPDCDRDIREAIERVRIEQERLASLGEAAKEEER